MNVNNDDSEEWRSTPTPSTDADQQYINKLGYISNRVSFYFVVTMPATAFCFNLFALLVLFVKLSQRTSTMVYLLKWQYVVDTIVIVNIVFNYQSAALFSYSLLTLSDLACRLFYVWNRFLIHLSSWIQVIISCDRFLNVYLARRLRIKRDKAKISYMIAAVIVGLLAVDMCNLGHYLGTKPAVGGLNGTNNSSSNNVTIACTASMDVQLATDIVSVLLRTLIPIGLMAAIDVVLIRHVKKIKNRLLMYRSQKSELHFTRSVILINGAFFCFNIPLSISLVMQNALAQSTTSLTARQAAELSLYASLASLFAFLFQTLEFFLNLALNRIFRQDILNVCSGGSAKRRRIGVFAFQMSLPLRNAKSEDPTLAFRT